MPTYKQLQVCVLILSFVALALPVAVGQQCTDAPNGMTGWWPGDDDADDYVCTSIPPGITICNDGILTNGASFGAGIVGNGFSLDGVDDYILIPDPLNLFDFDQSESFSWDAWVIPASFGGRQTILSKEDGSFPTWDIVKSCV